MLSWFLLGLWVKFTQRENLLPFSRICPLSLQALGTAPNTGAEGVAPTRPARLQRDALLCSRRREIWPQKSQHLAGVVRSRFRALCQGEARIRSSGCLQVLGGPAPWYTAPREAFRIGTNSRSTSSRARFSFTVERGLHLSPSAVSRLPTEPRSEDGL